MKDPLPPGTGPSDPLAYFWNRPVSELAAVNVEVSPRAQCERHSIYSLLTLSLVLAFWNGNKRGAEGNYPWRTKQRRADGLYYGDKLGDRYLGHNIACIAVDENGAIIDFDFNHNELYNSSAEHAESRLVRRIFSLNQIYDHWQVHAATDAVPIGYSNVFNGVTIYTSLESCAQCSGVMTLANVLRVVYLQADPGQYLVGNLLYNLTKPRPSPPALLSLDAVPRPIPVPKYFAPEPVSADVFGFGYKAELDRAYQEFAKVVTSDPTRFFYQAGGRKPDTSASITSFLCTDDAQEILERARAEFDGMTPQFPDHRPPRGDGQTAGVFSNREALEHARAFRNHAVNEARRGTPHR